MRTPLLSLILASSIGAAACGGSDSTDPANTTPTVTQVGIFWGSAPSPCQSATTMTFTVQVLDAKAGDALVVNFTGPGLPPTITENLTSSSQLVTAQWPVAKVAVGSSATWTAVVATVAGVKPDSLPGGHTAAVSSASC
jgi:hypothetical protein